MAFTVSTIYTQPKYKRNTLSFWKLRNPRTTDDLVPLCYVTYCVCYWLNVHFIQLGLIDINFRYFAKNGFRVRGDCYQLYCQDILNTPYVTPYKRPLPKFTPRNLQNATAAAKQTGRHHSHAQWRDVQQDRHKGPQHQCFDNKPSFVGLMSLAWHHTVHMADDLVWRPLPRTVISGFSISVVASDQPHPLQMRLVAPQTVRNWLSKSLRVALGVDWTSPMFDDDSDSIGPGGTSAGHLNIPWTSCTTPFYCW